MHTIVFYIFRALAKMSSISAKQLPEMCQELIGLAKRQQKICRRNVEVMDSVRYGAHMAIDECQFQFRNRRWNCSTVDPVKVFGNFLKLGEYLLCTETYQIFV